MSVQSGGGEYFLFVAVVFFLYWSTARFRLPRLAVILFANLLFCARYGLFYLALIPAAATVDFCVGLGLMRFQRPFVRRLLLAISVTLNLAILIGSRHMGALLDLRGGWDWVFPLGLSFYTFQSLTYTIELYRRDSEGTTSLAVYLAGASFFPTLQAGPIARLPELAKQFSMPPVLTRSEGGRAFFWIALGLLKKALIADFLAENLVNRVFDTPKLYSGAETLIAIYAYSLQLYFDFSGYTDIARGAALLLGIRLPGNFDRPYLSANIGDFWRRWHMSFSSWLRDYLYFALPGGRTKVMPYINLVITMLLGGLWHGIAWTFAIWGLLHGVALAAHHGWRRWRGRPKQPSRLVHAATVFFTYQFVCLTWVFFRAGSVPNALSVLGRVASLTPGVENISLGLALVLVAGAAAVLSGKGVYLRSMTWFAERPFYVHAAALVLVGAGLQLFGGHAGAPFVYSRF